MKSLLFHSGVPGVRIMNELILCLVSGERVTGMVKRRRGSEGTKGHYVIPKRSHGISEHETGVRETPLERETEMFSCCFIVWQMLKVFNLHNWRNYICT